MKDSIVGKNFECVRSFSIFKKGFKGEVLCFKGKHALLYSEDIEGNGHDAFLEEALSVQKSVQKIKKNCCWWVREENLEVYFTLKGFRW